MLTVQIPGPPKENPQQDFWGGAREFAFSVALQTLGDHTVRDIVQEQLLKF